VAVTPSNRPLEPLAAPTKPIIGSTGGSGSRRGRGKRQTGAIDGVHKAPLECPLPVADWVTFLAERLAAECLREFAERGSDP
jgi:hypothetical protein